MTFVPCLCALMLASAPPTPSRGDPWMASLEVPHTLRLAAAGDPPAADGAPAEGVEAGDPKEQERAKQEPRPAAGEPGSLDFDLLGAAAEARPVEERALHRRRSLLTWHQGVGLGMFTLQLATTVVGQLNYDDKFGTANTAKYVQPHALLAGATLAAFAAAGTLALLAPAPLPRDQGFDRVKLHKLSMLTATVGMAAQAALGIWAQSREGYLNQQGIGTAHLVVGYVTLAAVAAGVGALVL